MDSLKPACFAGLLTCGALASLSGCGGGSNPAPNANGAGATNSGGNANTDGGTSSGASSSGGSSNGGSGASSGSGGTGSGFEFAEACTYRGNPCAAEHVVDAGNVPRGIALRDGYVYYMGNGEVQRIDIDAALGGDAVPEVIRSADPNRVYFAVDGTELFQTFGSAAPAALRGPITQPALDAPVVGAARYPAGVLVTGTHVFFGDSGADGFGLIRIDKTSGDLASFVATPVDFAVDENTVYWRDALGNVARLAHASDDVEIIAPGTSSLGDVAVDPTTVYAATLTEEAPPAKIIAIDKATTTPELLSWDFNAATITADGGGLYISAEFHDENPAIYFLPTGTTEALPVVLPASGMTTGISLTTDDTYVYFIDRVSSDGAGAVFRAPKCGCE